MTARPFTKATAAPPTPLGDPETWRTVPGASRYEVSDQGRVRSWVRPTKPRILKPHAFFNGYLSVDILFDETGARRVRIHRLVLEAFVGPCPAGHEVRHLDGRRTNNHLSNLRWGTRSENVQDTLRHGNHPNASKTHCSAGHPFDVANTRVYVRGGSLRRACRECGRSATARWKARRRAAAS